ncbi:hypothetical protein GJ744_007188 [Endocarpon pusillum]|uniref:Uncharacterized protein n=1 Tax=Endocarpon pusillum TaxID=364733 RepID=A0A8H7E4D8_9EURO|nr:hypothetical protein GJ744_007188 [Endocarpon pusillum]
MFPQLTLLGRMEIPALWLLSTLQVSAPLSMAFYVMRKGKGASRKQKVHFGVFNDVTFPPQPSFDSSLIYAAIQERATEKSHPLAARVVDTSDGEAQLCAGENEQAGTAVFDEVQMTRCGIATTSANPCVLSMYNTSPLFPYPQSL